jgi:hypothetical protein
MPIFSITFVLLLSCSVVTPPNLVVVVGGVTVSHLRPFGYMCFFLKHGNLDKFESRSSDDISLGYTPHGRSYRVFNLETNTVVESCDVTFDETTPCPRDVFECAGDKEMEESIFVDEEL